MPKKQRVLLPIDPINRRNQRHEESGMRERLERGSPNHPKNVHELQLVRELQAKGPLMNHGDRPSQSSSGSPSFRKPSTPPEILTSRRKGVRDDKSNPPGKNSGAAGPGRPTVKNQIQPNRYHRRPTRSRTNSPEPTKVGVLEGKRLVCTTGNVVPYHTRGWFRAVVLLQSPGKSPAIRFYKKNARCGKPTEL